MNEIGLVFAGGGGKGAYVIGVWKYLCEIGWDKRVKVVSGTSVGALNAALFVGSNYEKAEKLWLNITPDKILTSTQPTLEEIMLWLSDNTLIKSNPIVNMNIMPYGKGNRYINFYLDKLARLILKQNCSDYLFSREGLISLISEGVDMQILHNSNISCYATCLRLPLMNIDRFKLNKYGADKITKILLASSAIPILFPYEIREYFSLVDMVVSVPALLCQ